MILRIAFISSLILSVVSNLPAQDFKKSFRRTVLENFEPPVLDAPKGYTILSAPSPQSAATRVVAGPTEIQVDGYVENAGNRYYLTRESFLAWFDDIEPKEWILIHNTGRSDFIARTIPAKLVGREIRDLFKDGNIEASIYEETVPVQSFTCWGKEYRHSDIDFLLPVKVLSFRKEEAGEWSATFSVFPNFNSESQRISGIWDNSDAEAKALITRPASLEVSLKGDRSSETISKILQPGIVCAAAMSEGRIQKLKVGELYPRWFNISTLSPPQFQIGDALSFRFQATRLKAEPVFIEITPEGIIGSDFTDYSRISTMGPPFSDDRNPRFEQNNWSVEIGPDQLVKVVAPLSEGRGAAGMLELESLGLESESNDYENDLEALLSLNKQKPPKLPSTSEGGWQSILQKKLGPVPASQQIQQ